MKKTRGGFTLIEMALSMVFIGILSVMMVLMIQNTMASYRRGLILNQLNTIGMDLIDDVRASIQNANTDALYKMCERLYADITQVASKEACEGDNGNSFVSVTKYGNVKVDGNSLGTLPVYGAFCTGTYTYIWNSGYFEEGDYDGQRQVSGVKPEASNGVSLRIGATNEVISGFRLLKIYDRERTVCVNANNAQGGGYRVINGPDYSDANVPGQFVIDDAMISGKLGDKNSEGGVELLKVSSANDLVLYDFYMSRPATSETRKNLFFAGSFILGTRKGGVNSITTSGNSCKPPADATGYSNLEYCAINKFNFAVQAGGS
ncbi:hypothetical protein IJG27_01760 [Candidatus Saccharibacteria bacterium]|nr:hypothetical protein [Candidatus Saccharibacteria bacterium]